jgi:hypothetical protein
MHASLRPHYGSALILAVALVIIPWAFAGWVVWTLT